MGSGPDARKPSGPSVSRLRKLSGDSIRLDQSGCPLPPESTFYVIDLIIDKDGSAEIIQYLRGTPTECIRGYVERLVSTWRFEPPTADGRPTQLRYSHGFASPGPSGP